MALVSALASSAARVQLFVTALLQRSLHDKTLQEYQQSVCFSLYRDFNSPCRHHALWACTRATPSNPRKEL
jgi:hypothetical protein